MATTVLVFQEIDNFSQILSRIACRMSLQPSSDKIQERLHISPKMGRFSKSLKSSYKVKVKVKVDLGFLLLSAVGVLYGKNTGLGLRGVV